MMRRFPTTMVISELSTPPLPSSHDGKPRRLLTPEPHSIPNVKPNGVFFRRLPSEIRARILRLAFGDRTIHVDLIHSHPILPDPERHAGVRQMP
ncbi:hypothetical protein FGADI_5584 [Fusarium gaditjirri]|uniref:Uncharacterized protein n=1 Tax=Fusarium gaditjirri TaxID=282569 RepID=A0A8H4WXF9_9HYPO|nr:hypothetical protein FGADI_5584 [Fusarium gaditjirri]